MATGGYKILNQDAVHFITFAVVGWVDVFTRKDYCDLVVNSLTYCQQQKGLIIYGWCIMSNHLHLAVAARNNNLSDILRDFKKHTSKQLVQAIAANPMESRKEWMLHVFAAYGKNNSRNTYYQFWQHDNQPKEMYTDRFFNQKLDYLHNNPVAAGMVDKAEAYIYSSARDYYVGKKVGLIKVKWL